MSNRARRPRSALSLAGYSRSEPRPADKGEEAAEKCLCSLLGIGDNKIAEQAEHLVDDDHGA
jgi:hypothetical protein